MLLGHQQTGRCKCTHLLFPPSRTQSTPTVGSCQSTSTEKNCGMVAGWQGSSFITISIVPNCVMRTRTCVRGEEVAAGSS